MIESLVSSEEVKQLTDRLKSWAADSKQEFLSLAAILGQSGKIERLKKEGLYPHSCLSELKLADFGGSQDQMLLHALEILKMELYNDKADHSIVMLTMETIKESIELCHLGYFRASAIVSSIETEAALRRIGNINPRGIASLNPVKDAIPKLCVGDLIDANISLFEASTIYECLEDFVKDTRQLEANHPLPNRHLLVHGYAREISLRDAANTIFMAHSLSLFLPILKRKMAQKDRPS